MWSWNHKNLFLKQVSKSEIYQLNEGVVNTFIFILFSVAFKASSRFKDEATSLSSIIII